MGYALTEGVSTTAGMEKGEGIILFYAFVSDWFDAHESVWSASTTTAFGTHDTRLVWVSTVDEDIAELDLYSQRGRIDRGRGGDHQQHSKGGEN
jgi:hypothetical protein